jgi:hypothetical protein
MEANCILSKLGTEFLYTIYIPFTYDSRAIDHAFSQRFLSEGARVRFQDSLCEVCGGQSGIGTESSPSIPPVIPQRSFYFK